MRKADFEAMLRRLERFGYAVAEHPWLVTKNTPFGCIEIKPDFAYHLLEIAFPPCSDLTSFTPLFDEVLREADDCLDELGFERRHESFLHVERADFDLVEIARLEGYLDCLQQKSCRNAFADRHFPAFLAATHIHMNVLSENDLRLLPLLYELEWLALSLFDRTNHPELPIRSLRTMYYRDAFGHDYRLVGVPERIPTTLEAYAKLYSASAVPQRPVLPGSGLHIHPPHPLRHARVPQCLLARGCRNAAKDH